MFVWAGALYYFDNASAHVSGPDISTTEITKFWKLHRYDVTREVESKKLAFPVGKLSTSSK